VLLINLNVDIEKTELVIIEIVVVLVDISTVLKPQREIEMSD
jgi:hypothetical protein